MSRALIAGLLRRTLEPSDPPSDADLLARFLRSRDESAFELLVWRHSVMVAGVCRRIVPDAHLAEDAFQAVFLVLARKAGSVRGSNLAGWLFRVARRVAIRAKHQTASRSKRETPLADQPSFESCDVEDRERFAILDEEVARLPERFRLPVLLCYLGGNSTEEAGRLLNCPRGTILSRLATARQRLAARLTRRGVTLPAGSIATIAGVPSVATVAGMVPATVRSAIAPCSGIPPIAGDKPASQLLAEGVLRTMKASQLVTTAGVAIVALGIVTGVGLVTAQPRPTVTVGIEPVQPAPLTPAAKQGEKPAQPPAANPPMAQDAERARDERMKRLELLARTLRAELRDKEMAVVQVTRSHASSIQEANRFQEMVRRLDADIAVFEREMLTEEATLAVLKKRLADRKFSISDRVIEQAVEASPPVGVLLQERQKTVARLDAFERTTDAKADSPQRREFQTEIARVDKKLEAERTRARAAAETTLKAEAEEQLRRRIAELEERIEVGKAVLAALKRNQDEVQTVLAKHGKVGQEMQSLMSELEPMREALHKVEAARIQLLIERDLPPQQAAAPGSSDAKLDAVLKELQELRKEVRELKKP